MIHLILIRPPIWYESIYPIYCFPKKHFFCHTQFIHRFNLIADLYVSLPRSQRCWGILLFAIWRVSSWWYLFDRHPPVLVKCVYLMIHLTLHLVNWFLGRRSRGISLLWWIVGWRLLSFIAHVQHVKISIKQRHLLIGDKLMGFIDTWTWG